MRPLSLALTEVDLAVRLCDDVDIAHDTYHWIVWSLFTGSRRMAGVFVGAGLSNTHCLLMEMVWVLGPPGRGHAFPFHLVSSLIFSGHGPFR